MLGVTHGCPPARPPRRPSVQSWARVMVALGAFSCGSAVTVSNEPTTANFSLTTYLCDDGGTPEVHQLTTATTTLPPPPGGQEPCIGVELLGIGFSAQLSLDCPSGTGSFLLEDLHATLCSCGCSSLSGTLTVRTFTPHCSNGACAHLDADIVVPATPPMGREPTITGRATLLYKESITTSCMLGLG
jgi:hypothetical protein